MRSHVLTAILICFTTILGFSQIADNISFDVNNVNLTNEHGFTRISMAEYSAINEIGAPELPCLELLYVIPYNQQITTVSITDSTWQQIQGEYTVYPTQPVYAMDDTTAHEFVEPLRCVYENSNLYPNRPVIVSEQYYDNGYHFAKVLVYPIQYEPLQNRLYFYSNMHFQINFEATSDAIQRPKTQSRQITELIDIMNLSKIRNTSDYALSGGGPLNITEINDPAHNFMPMLVMKENVDPQYIIITNNYDVNGNLIEDNDQPGLNMNDIFQEFADYKTSHGIPTKVVTIDEICVNYTGNDTQEKIHNFLDEVYRNYGKLYVLFGGDVNIVPERMMDTLVFNSKNYIYPSDLYYVAVNVLWDNNENGVYGEDSDFTLNNENPQFYYGRASVENISEALTFVNKNNAYENMTNVIDRSYVDNIVALVRGENYMRAVEGGLGKTKYTLNQNGLLENAIQYGVIQPDIIKWRIYDTIFPFNYDLEGNEVNVSWDWENHNTILSKETALACFGSAIPSDTPTDSEHAHFVFHIDHSSYLNLGTSTKILNQSINREDVNGLANAPYYQIIYTGGCEPGEYHKDCITERFVNNPNGGAVAMFASSSTSSNEYYGFVGMLRNLYYSVYNSINLTPSNYTLGALHNNNLSAGSLVNYFNKRKHHLFGDPTLPVWTRTPLDLTVITSLTNTSNSLNKTLTVSVSGMDYAEYATNDVMVCVMKDDEVYLRELYNGTAHSHDFVFIVAPETAGYLTVTVTGHNYIPYQTTVPVTITTKNLYVSNRCVIDDTHGNDNGKAEAGETFNIGVTLKNSGNANLTNITGIIRYSFADPAMNNLINRIDSTANFGNIPMGDSATANNFKLALSNAVPDGTIMTCTLLLSENSNGGSRPYSATKTFTLRVGASEMEYVSVSQETLQNSDIQLDIDVINQGYGQATDITAKLASNDVIITQGTAMYGDFNHLENKKQHFAFATNKSYENAQFTLTLTDAYNKTWTYDFNLHTISTTVENLAFTSTEQSIKLTWDPVANSNGYYIYRSLTENGEYERLNSYPVPSSFYTDLGLQAMQTYYYAVSYLDSNGNESPRATITAWTSLPMAAGWPVEIPDSLARVWGTAANTADIDGDGKQEIFLTTGNGDHGGNIGTILAFNHLGEELYDIDHNPTSTSGFANVGVSMTCTPAIADIDNDGIDEIVVATRFDAANSNSSHKLLVYKNNDADNDGCPDLAWQCQIDRKNFNGVVLADLDNNGTMEIIVPNEGRNGSNGMTKIEVFNCYGVPIYYDSIVVNDIANKDQKAVTMPVVADLNNDGNNEIAFGFESGLYLWKCGTRELDTLVASNDTMYRLDCPVIAADIDADGTKEILYGKIHKSATQKPTMHLYAIKPDKTSVSGWGADNHFVEMSHEVLHYMWQPYFTVADIDNNGTMEIFLADNDTLKMWNADGTPYGVGLIRIPGLDCKYFQPVIADIDGNGDCEIIIPSNDGNIYAYKSNGNFVPGWPLQVSELKTIPVVTDIDGDGLNEVIAASQTTVYVWHTNGSSNLTPSSRFRYNQYNNAVYEVPCPTSYLPLAVNTTDTWNTNRIVNRNIEIEDGATLTISSQVSLTREASIIVKPSGKLIIDGGTLTSACPGEMWQGIQVWGNSSAPQTATNGVYQQGYVELKNGATIENAVCALDLWKPNDLTKTGGIAVATDAYFINNAKAVRAVHYVYVNGNNAEVSNKTSFSNCDFVIDEYYLGTEMFHEHAELEDVKGINFSGCSFDVFSMLDNVSDNCSGIRATDANFVVSAYFDPQNVTLYPTSVPTFSNFHAAIKAVHSACTQRPFNVSDAVFTSNTNGIYAINTGNPSVSECEFNIPNCGSQCSYGIYVEGVSGMLISDNEFIDNGYGTNSCGIGVKDSPYTNTVKKNNFSNLAYGNKAMGLNYNPQFFMFQAPEGLKYTCNTNSGNRMADFHITNVTGNLFGGLMPQGSSSLSAGNTFSVSPIYHIFNSTSGNTLDYYYDTIYSNRKPTSIQDVNLIKANTANNCSSGNVNKGSIITDYEEAEDNCNSIVAALEAENDPNNIEVLEAELAQAEHQRLTIVGNAVRDILMDSISDINEVRQWFNRANTPSADRAICATYLSQGDYETALDKAAAMIDKYEMEDEVLIEQTEYIGILKLQKKVESEGRVMGQLNSVELGQVQRLAENGTGVARSIAKAIMMMNGMAEAECDCNSELAETTRGNEGTKADAITENEEDNAYYFNISPVPAKDYIIVSYSLPTDHATLTITNNLGMTIKTVNIEGRQGKKVVSLSDVMAGVYAFTIQGEEYTKTEKIVVTK